MSDALTIAETAGPPATSRPSVQTPTGRVQLTPKVKAACDAMVYEGLEWQAAATKANLSTRRMRTALETPHVQRYLREQKQVYRASASSSNIRRAVQIRDQDESRTAAIQAIRYLDGLGEQDRADGAARAVSPGVVVKVAIINASDRRVDETIIEVNPMGVSELGSQDDSL